MTLDELVDPEFHDVLAAAVRILEVRCARGIATGPDEAIGDDEALIPSSSYMAPSGHV
jgi:hypothetical protein